MLTKDQVRLAENLGLNVEKLNQMPHHEATEALISMITVKRRKAARAIPPGSLVSYEGITRRVTSTNHEGFLLLKGRSGSVNPMNVQVLKGACLKELPP